MARNRARWRAGASLLTAAAQRQGTWLPVPNSPLMSDQERFQVYIFVADAKEGDDECRYTVEQWFADRPGVETVAGLFEEAKRDFHTLYPESEAVNFSVDVSRLRPRDQIPAPSPTSE